MFTKRAVLAVLVASVACVGTAWAQGDAKEETLKAKVVETKPAEEAKPAAAPAAATATAASASSGGLTATMCTNGENRRSVTLTSSNPSTNLPCEVHYKKETEQPGHDQVLWTAANDLAFCESKAQAFVEKLTSWGWSCVKN
jgi:hypothetical protein